MLSMTELRESLLLAEVLAQKELSSRDDKSKQTLTKARKTSYAPPKQLLLYLVRMGSFTSERKLESDEDQDEDLEVPSRLSAGNVLAWVREPLQHFPPMLTREYRWVESAQRLLPKESFRVMQWNVLAQALGLHADNFVRCPSEALQWNTRRFRLLEEILTHRPHVLCLQEVDHYNLLEKVLATQGYQGVFVPKPDSPCVYVEGNNGPDGCAIFWDEVRFKVVSTSSRILEVWHVQSNQVAVLVVLQDLHTSQELSVTCTHLKARHGAFLSRLRNEQGEDLLTFVQQHGGERPAFICGDFNAGPKDLVYSTMTAPATNLSSAFARLNGGSEPKYSTWNIRGEGETCRNIDYVFYEPRHLKVVGGLEAPSGEMLGVDRAPSLSYPSDHFSLVCDFVWSQETPEAVVVEQENVYL